MMGLALAVAFAACQPTVDTLGYNDAQGIVLHPMTPPDSYLNVFGEVLGKSDAEIAAKLAGAFQQLFHGDPATEAIYRAAPGPPDQAYIWDVLHDDVRTEGMGLGMLITVELDKRDEFDRLWTYAQVNLQEKSGAARGYFGSFCMFPAADSDGACHDPYGHEHMLMALLLAYDRWGDPVEGGPDYAAGAKQLLTVMRHRQDENGGIVDGVTDTFDPSTHLAFALPIAGMAGQTRPSIETPAFYQLWAEAAADPFWSRAAVAGRQLWRAAAHPETGLGPIRSRFDGTPVPGADFFGAESYRTLVNVVLDRIWSPTDGWDVAEANTVLQFFIGKGMSTYGRSYSLDGTIVVDSQHDNALVMANGIAGLIASIDARRGFIQAVWDMDVPTGNNRYYAGILQMLGLLILSGKCKVY
jgi:oligosaccharide reducing-end xylanase